MNVTVLSFRGWFPESLRLAPGTYPLQTEVTPGRSYATSARTRGDRRSSSPPGASSSSPRTTPAASRAPSRPSTRRRPGAGSCWRSGRVSPAAPAPRASCRPARAAGSTAPTPLPSHPSSPRRRCARRPAGRRGAPRARRRHHHQKGQEGPRLRWHRRPRLRRTRLPAPVWRYRRRPRGLGRRARDLGLATRRRRPRRPRSE